MIYCGFGSGYEHYSDEDGHNDSDDDAYVNVEKYDDHENGDNL